MTGDYTKVALRAGERWETAPAQEGRALLDHELNLNAVASTRRDRRLARDTIGPAGVVEGSTAFQVGVTASGPLDLTVAAGHLWVDGLAAVASGDFLHSEQDQIEPLPVGGRALVYLDAWEEHVQPAEDPALADPALAPIDTAARTRVGYRVRAVPTTATTCASAWAGFDPAPLSTGTLHVARIGPAVPADPCDPPGDAQGLLPDGMLRVEVLDAGTAASARFAWSYENGAAAVSIAALADDTVTLHPSTAVTFGNDLVEISWLARRADRASAGSLYQVTAVSATATGDVLTLDRAVTAPAGADGLAVRRWDGHVIGATVERNAERAGNDLGVRFRATAGTYRPGDWWGARVRQADGVEVLDGAEPDGTRHASVPLALVDLDARAVIEDCRPTFRPLVGLELRSPCTVVVRPGDDVQAAVDTLPPSGGEVCLAAGRFVLVRPVTVAGLDRVRVTGVGPATVVESTEAEIVLSFTDSDDVELSGLTLVAAVAASAADADSLNGAATFAGCRGVSVHHVGVIVPDGPSRRQAALTVRERGNRRPERVRVEGCDLRVGAGQIGLLVTEGADVVVDGNHVGLAAAAAGGVRLGIDLVAEVDRLFRASVVPAGTPASSVLAIPGGGSVAFLDRSPVAPIAREFASTTPAPGGPRPRRDPFARFLAAAVPDDGARLGPAAIEALVAVAGGSRAVGQGIVVGGRRIASLRISGNTIRDARQGIHVGASHAGPGRDDADEVLIGGNTVHLALPWTWNRERHAVFVGNARSIHVTDTRATLRRLVTVPGVAETAVDAVRLVGVFGPFVTVRGISSSGFHVGVRAEPLNATPNRRVWSLSEVLADQTGASGAVAPPSFARTLVAP